MIALGYILAFLYGIFCLLLAHVAYKLGMPKIYTRKLVHVLVGFEWVILYFFHGTTIHSLVVCIAFLALLFIVSRKNLMPMISSESDNSLGTVYYAVAMSVMAAVCLLLPELMIPFGMAAFCTSFGDGFAGIVGQSIKRKNPRIYGNKTLFGTLANFVFSFASAETFVLIFDLNLTVWHSIAIAFICVCFELLGVLGFDNILLPLAVFSLSSAFIYFDGIENYLAPILLTPVVLLLVKKKKLLTKGGVLAAVLVDAVISITLGNFGFAILLTFLILGALSDRIKPKKVQEKQCSNERNWKQVLANSAIPAVLSVIYFITQNNLFAVCFAAALAEALADTFSSSFGSLAPRAYDIIRMKRIKKGLSGGVSLVGSLFGLIGGMMIALVSFAFGITDAKIFIIILSSAFLGMLFDSVLGSLFQVKYKCPVCGEITEKRTHCDTDTVHNSGLKCVNNNVVNLLSTLFSAGLAAFLFLI